MALPISTQQLELNGSSVTTADGQLQMDGATIPAHSRTVCVDPTNGGFSSLQAAYNAVVASGVTHAVIQLGVGNHGTVYIDFSETVVVEFVGLGRLSQFDLNVGLSGTKRFYISNVTVGTLQIASGTGTLEIVGNGRIETFSANTEQSVSAILEGHITCVTISAGGQEGNEGTAGESNPTTGIGETGGNGENGTDGMNLNLQFGAHVQFCEVQGGNGGVGGVGGDGGIEGSGGVSGDGGNGGNGGNGGAVTIGAGCWIGQLTNNGGDAGAGGLPGEAASGGTYGAEGSQGSFGSPGSLTTHSFSFPVA